MTLFDIIAGLSSIMGLLISLFTFRLVREVSLKISVNNQNNSQKSKVRQEKNKAKIIAGRDASFNRTQDEKAE